VTRVLRTVDEPSIHQDPDQGAPPTPRKIEIAAIVYPAVDVVERCAAKILFNSEAQRKVYVQPQAMMVRIDLHHP
jgi:hypothetical protein